MTVRDSFTLVIRLLGLVALGRALVLFVRVIGLLTTPTTMETGRVINQMLPMLAAALILVLVGLYFLRGAPRIVRYAFRGAPPSSNTSNSGGRDA